MPDSSNVFVTLSGVVCREADTRVYLKSPDNRLLRVYGELPQFENGDKATISGYLTFTEDDVPVLEALEGANVAPYSKTFDR